MIKFWTYSKEYKNLRKKILRSIDGTLKSGDIFYGNELKKFENKFSQLYKLKYGAAVGSGTDSLKIALAAFGIGKGDEVITVSNTAIPTVAAIVSSGATVKYVDVNEDYLINSNNIEECISRKTKAIIPVHLYGNVCDMDKICRIAKKFNLKVIEDCAQAQGAKYKNRFVGSIGDAGCFSFYPTKILGGYGDGGFISTKSSIIYNKIKRIRFYGIEFNNSKNKFNKKYYANEQGTNSRISEIQIAILNLKLPRVNYWIKKRKQLSKIYHDYLKKSDLKLPIENKNCKHVYHLFVVYHPKRNAIIRELNKNNISTNINYPYPIHKMKAYKDSIKLPITEKVAKGIFSLPLYPDLKVGEVKKIANILKNILSKIK